MLLKYILRVVFTTIIVLVNYSCIESFDFESEIETFESALVVEAMITNELKPQEILLSRVFRLEEDGPSPESGAQVKIIDDTNTEYLFIESDSAGTYISTMPFAAKPDYVYTLLITTAYGKGYNSSPTKLTQDTKMDSLYAVRDFNEDGKEGVSIYVDSYDPTGNSQYYRYEYEEAYKIIAPRWVSDDLICVRTDGIFVDIVFRPRPYGELICYNVVKSNDILITNTLDLAQDRLEQHRVLFLNRNNYIISHRYSIEVKQYVQSRAAYIYYETLKKISHPESLFSENQPGFIEGNISSVDQRGEKVIGFFEVSAVDTKRIYFNYKDVFPGEQLPPYVAGCTPYSPSPEILCYDLFYGGKKFWDLNLVYDPVLETPYLLVPGECGDCTTLGKSEAPDFWIE